MQTIRVQTTQNVYIQYPLASIGDRLVAFIIDYLILSIYVIAVFSLLVKLDVEIWWVWLLAIGFPILFYSLAFEILMNGQSPGKMIMKVKVVHLDGTQPTIGSYLFRWLFRFVDFSISSGAVAMITIAASERSQRVGDMVAGTTVIKLTDQKEVTSDDLFIVTEENYVPVFQEVINLSSRDIELVQQALEVNRNYGNSKPALIATEKIKGVLGIDSEMPPVKFLYTIVRDYNHLTAQPA